MQGGWEEEEEVQPAMVSAAAAAAATGTAQGAELDHRVVLERLRHSRETPAEQMSSEKPLDLD